MDPNQLTITEALQQFAKGNLTSVELTQSYLDWIKALNPKLNAYLTVTEKEALAAAKESDSRKKKKSPLDGIPIAIKDNFMVSGVRTTAGSKILDDFIAVEDATSIKRLKRAGAVILGKTILDEFAMGSSTEHSAYGPSSNPWDTTRVPGGSSGGSAVAVAADLAAGALGSDTGGSIRQPAGFCSIVGLKPTYGAVSRYGLVALASSLDCPGPFGKTVADTRLLFETIAGQDPLDATSVDVPRNGITRNSPMATRGLKGESRVASRDLRGVHIGIPKEYFGEGLDKKVGETVKAAIKKLEELGAEIVDISLPHSEYALAVYYIIQPAEASSNLARYDGIKYGFSVEKTMKDTKIGQVATNPATNLLDVYLTSRGQGFGAETKRRIMLGTYTLSAGYYEAYYKKALQVRTLVKQDFDQAFEKVDYLVSPTSPTMPWKFGEKADPLSMYLADIYTVAINVAGVPAVSIPCGFVDDLPVGLQIIGRHKDDYGVLAVVEAYEQATEWHRRKPPVEVRPTVTKRVSSSEVGSSTNNDLLRNEHRNRLT
jgi:aspartyl-tRNA(Asn)/glutamyl-tRNA(Gln) amidotransferase subunit A